MRKRRAIWLVLVFAAACRFSSGEDIPEVSFVLKIGYTTFVSPAEVNSTCLAVFPDGRFHLERWSDSSGDAPRIFEDSISSQSLESLKRLLDEPVLKDVKPTYSQESITDGEYAWGVIPREQASQKFASVAWDTAAGRPEKLFPAGLRPLLQWTETTVGEINRRRLPPRKGKATECWLKAEKQGRKKKK